MSFKNSYFNWEFLEDLLELGLINMDTLNFSNNQFYSFDPEVFIDTFIDLAIVSTEKSPFGVRVSDFIDSKRIIYSNFSHKELLNDPEIKTIIMRF